jgi:CubicO group peptidase (beta-lactamase class C family)
MAKRVLVAAAVATALCALWSTLVVTWALQGACTPIAAGGDASAFMAATVERVKRAGIGNCALALIEDGGIFDSYVYFVDDPIDDGTLFQMASVSKWVTSWGVMALVRQARLELDVPVSRYLTRWQLPPSKFDNNGVTVRRLLGHTVGSPTGSAYGFRRGRGRSCSRSLTNAADRMPGVDGHARVGRAPGSHFQYSGGGFALLQLIIEEVTHDQFAHFMQQTVLEPLGMVRSTFDEDLAMARGIARSYAGSAPAMHYHFSAPGAASLYSDLADLTRFVMAHLPGETASAGARRSRQDAGRDARADGVAGRRFLGLGAQLYVESGASTMCSVTMARTIGDQSRGSDPPATRGVVICRGGGDRFAMRLAADWVVWKTGNGANSRLGTLLGPLHRAGVIVALVAAWVIRNMRSRRRGWDSRIGSGTTHFSGTPRSTSSR